MTPSLDLLPRTARVALNLSAICAVGALLTGCVVEEPRRRVYEPRVVVAETAPMPPPAAYVEAPVPVPREEIVIQMAPPPPRQEVVLVRPSPRHVWIAGYWGWRGGRHEWIAGRWELPPRGRSVWVQPRWERRNGNYVFIEGFWR